MKTLCSRYKTRKQTPWPASLPSLWLFSCLAIAGLIFGYQSFAPPRNDAVAVSLTSASEQVPPTTKPIELIRVGDRVWADPTHGETDVRFGDSVTPAEWRTLAVRASKAGGGYADVELLRPLTWIHAQQATVGKQIDLQVPECGINGNAEVLSISACPGIVPGTGKIVTAVFRHSGADILDLYIDGNETAIGTTAAHPFWSETKQSFVRADELAIGERLRTLAGIAEVVRIVRRNDIEPVFNLEVQVSHVYHVGIHGVLVHNGTTKICPKVMSTDTVKKNLDELGEAGSAGGDYAIHGHHFYPKWLGGAADGPLIKVRGYEHLRELEPELWEHMKKSLPKITQRTDKKVQDLLDAGEITQDEITDALVEFYKKRYPQYSEKTIRDTLEKAL
jgi:hypothetical protein